MTEKPKITERYLRRDEAAEYLTGTYGFSVSRSWLAKLATIGGGPIYRKAGRTPIYSREDLDKWAQDRLSAPLRATGVPAHQKDN